MLLAIVRTQVSQVRLALLTSRSSGVSRTSGGGARSTRLDRRSLSGSAWSKGSLAAGEEAVDAAIDTLSESLCGGRGAITLVALRSAVVGVNYLRSVGTSISKASGLAHNIASSAVQGAAHCRSKSGWDGRSRGGSDRGLRHSENASNERKDDSGVLHGDGWSCTVRDGAVR
jgi:hypothetical protein